MQYQFGLSVIFGLVLTILALRLNQKFKQVKKK